MRRNVIWAAAGVVVTFAALLGWYFFIRDDAPAPLSLDAAVSDSSAPVTAAPDPTPTPTTAEPATAATTPVPVPTTAPGSGDLWAIDQGGTIVGYRIQEELARIGGNVAVGRTSQVTGSLSLDSAVITEVLVVVDMTTLQSDDNRRDGQLRSRGLQTNEFPEASFVLDEAIDLGTLPAMGVPITVTARGTLTLHGVSRAVSVPLDAQLTDESSIVAVGRVEVALADYDIEPPTGFSVLSVADVGEFEFQLTFRA